MTKGKVVLAALGAALAISLALAHMYGPGYGPGPGMMGGGGYGPGYGMGPGLMGQGSMAGMMGGMGPGMMGAYGMGPGMMGPGMMGGYGGYGGGRPVEGLGLTAEQQQKLFDIQREVAGKRWELMGKLHAEGGPMEQAFSGGPFDEKAAREAYDAMAAAHKQMFEAMLDARKRMEAVLTAEQREQLNRNFGGRLSNR